MRMRCWAFLDEEDDVVGLTMAHATFIRLPGPMALGFQLPRAHSGEDISARLSRSMVNYSYHVLVH